MHTCTIRHELTMFSQESQTKKNLSIRQEKPPFEGFIRVVRVTHRTIENTGVDLGCFSLVDCGPFLLKTLHSYDIIFV